MNEVFDCRPDVKVLFLGINDIDISEDCAFRVAKGLKDIIKKLRDINSVVIFVEIEWLDFEYSQIPNLTKEIYNACRKTINHNVYRYYREHHVRTINIGNTRLERVRRDGVHLDTVAADHIKVKLQRAICHEVENLSPQ